MTSYRHSIKWSVIALFCFLYFLMMLLFSGPPTKEELSFASEKTIVDLKFKSLDSWYDERRSSRFIDLKYAEGKCAFLESLDIPDERLHRFYHPVLAGFEYLAVETKDDSPHALYIDLDASGSLTSDEKILSCLSHYKYGDFKPPEFEINNFDGDCVLYKMLFKAWVNDEGKVRLQWKPFCKWEGQALVENISVHFSLFDTNGNGSFRDYGEDYLDIQPATWAKSIRRVLSSLICWDDQYYKLSFSGKESKGGDFAMTLAEVRSPPGNYTIQWEGIRDSSPFYYWLRLRGNSDRSIVFNWNDHTDRLPAGEYIIEDGDVEIIRMTDDGVSAHFNSPTPFEIESGKTSTLKLGKPRLEIVIYAEGQYEHRDKHLKDGFPLDMDLKIGHKVFGCGGERYSEFHGHWFIPLPCMVSINDPKGREVRCKPRGSFSFIPYDHDKDEFIPFTWPMAASRVPGEYTITLNLHTGCLFGELEKTIKIIRY